MIKKGDRVRIILDTPTNTPVSGIVRIVQEEAGKNIGVELDETTANAHDLDGVLDRAKVDPTTGIRYGRGWWTLEDRVEKE